MIHFSRPLLAASFLRRDNRFRAALQIEGREVSAHVANSGRLGELLAPGNTCYAAAQGNPARKTPYDLCLVAYAGVLVSVDARLPNPLLADTLARGCLPQFAGYTGIRGEAVRGQSRLDFLLTDGGGNRCWIETKSVTLVEDGLALFPDAPTLRGCKHLEELGAAVAGGDRAALVFVVQRPDARCLAPHVAADPAFAAALARAAAAGVEVYAYTCQVSLAGVEMAQEIGISAARQPAGST